MLQGMLRNRRLRAYWSTVGLVLAVLVSGTVIAAAAGENLVPNYDFSEGADEQGEPLYWTVVGGSAVNTVTLSDERATVGEYSVLFWSRQAGAPKGLRSAQIPVTPNRTYELTVDLYVEDATHPMIYIEFWSAAGERIATESTQLRGDAVVRNRWIELKVTGTAPFGAAYVTAYLYSSSANVGRMFFDNVRLVEK